MRLYDCEVGMIVKMPEIVDGKHTGQWRHGTIIAEHNTYNPADTVAVEWSDGQRQLVTARSLLNETEYAEQANKERLQKMSIKKEDCAIDTRVALVGYGTPFRKGKIASPVTDNIVIVEFDDGTLKKHDLKTLMLIRDALVEEKRLADLEKARLEKQFEAERQVAEKINAASALVAEAAKIAKAIGKSLRDMDVSDEVENMVEEAGWSTSSWHC